MTDTYWETAEDQAAAQRLLVALEEWRAQGGQLTEVLTALQVLARGASVHKLYQLIRSRVMLDLEPLEVQTDENWRLFVRINGLGQPVVLRPEQSLRVSVTKQGVVELHLVTPPGE